ncbi:FAD-dependent oxidoreductase [Variovorax sp. VNK109]|uniref:FAD-dependent oxidoreductase n=1 Tax=Variovorax sp. VNK109 TaxID=3400919 RepID=UPI003BFDE826
MTSSPQPHRTGSAAPQSAVILGSGLMGRLLAVQLARLDWRCELHDAAGPDADGAAARVAAAMLAPLAESAITEPVVVRMGVHALGRWPELLAQLSQPVFFQQQGTLVVWHRQDAPEAARFLRQVETTTRGIDGLAAIEQAGAARIAALEPSLAGRFPQALYLPGEGQLDNRQLLAALLHELQALNVPMHWNSPKETGDFRAGEAGQPQWVIDCRGLGARNAWPHARGGTALRGVRGEVARVHAPEVTLSRPTRLMHPRYPIYIAPKEDHLFVIGATEIESDDMSPASVRSTLELLSAAYTVHSGFAEARILEVATQCRPALPDNLPAIHQSAPGVLHINGLYRHGFMIAPTMLDAALPLLTHGDDTVARQFDLLK